MLSRRLCPTAARESSQCIQCLIESHDTGGRVAESPILDYDRGIHKLVAHPQGAKKMKRTSRRPGMYGSPHFDGPVCRD